MSLYHSQPICQPLLAVDLCLRGHCKLMGCKVTLRRKTSKKCFLRNVFRDAQRYISKLTTTNNINSFKRKSYTKIYRRILKNRYYFARCSVCNSPLGFTAEMQEILHLEDAASQQGSRWYLPVLQIANMVCQACGSHVYHNQSTTRQTL